MLSKVNRTTDVRTSISDPLRIDTVMIPAVGATPSFTLGITLSPGLKSRGVHGKDWDRDLFLDLDEIETWRPTVIAHISNLYSEAFNTMSSRFTSERVHLVKTSSWPVPEVTSEITSRDRTCCRIINLMRSLSLEDPSSSLRLLINGYHGGQECATLSAQVVMRAGHTREGSVELIENIRSGLVNSPRTEVRGFRLISRLTLAPFPARSLPAAESLTFPFPASRMAPCLVQRAQRAAPAVPAGDEVRGR